MRTAAAVALLAVLSAPAAFACNPGTCQEIQIVPQGQEGLWTWAQVSGDENLDVDDISIAAITGDSEHVNATLDFGTISIAEAMQLTYTIKKYTYSGGAWVYQGVLDSGTFGPYVWSDNVLVNGEPICYNPATCGSSGGVCTGEGWFCSLNPHYCSTLGVCISEIGNCDTTSGDGCVCERNLAYPNPCPGPTGVWGPTRVAKCLPSGTHCVVEIDSNYLW